MDNLKPFENQYLEIKPSNIHGNGLFAKQDLKKGQHLCDYFGIKIHYKDFVEKYGRYKDNSIYTYSDMRNKKIICAKEEPYLSRNWCNYINECNLDDEPNCIFKKFALYTIKDIEKGTELLVKYPKRYNRNYVLQSSK